MSALVLKSGNALSVNVDSLDFIAYKNRVLADGGFIANEQALRDAFSFVSANGIAPNEVFSATSASWGVKLEAGKPKKLYSLFSDAGDIDVIFSSSSAIDYDVTKYTVPVVSLRATINNILNSKGSANNVLTSGICVISKVPLLELGTTYGAFQFFGIADLSDPSASTEVGISQRKRIHTASYFRASASELPTVWKRQSDGYWREGTVADTTTNDATKWNHSASFLKNGRMAFYDKGILKAEDNAVVASSYADNLKFTIGRTKGNSLTADSYIVPLYGDVAEAWCLINTTEVKMQALSLRASKKYIN